MSMVVVLVPAEISGHNVGFIQEFDSVKLPYTAMFRPLAQGPGPRVPKY